MLQRLSSELVKHKGTKLSAVLDQATTSILSLGAVSNVANEAVDDKVIDLLNEGGTLSLPDGFIYATSKPLHTKAWKSFNIVCPNGEATLKSTGNYTQLTQDGPYQFQNCIFSNIIFEGNGAQDPADLHMKNEPGKWCANFITYNCTWKSFYTVWKASWIAVYHYYPTFFSVNDNGYILDTPVASEQPYAAFNLNKLVCPRFMEMRARMLFRVIGGFNFTVDTPWFERLEMFGKSCFQFQQFFNLKFIDIWFERFKTQNFLYLSGDGTENTQSDNIVFDGVHINNNHENSGFSNLILMHHPEHTGNYTDTKCFFKNIYEHTSSKAGWCLLRASDSQRDVVNRAENLQVIEGIRVKEGQPPTSEGLKLGASSHNPQDIWNSVRRLTTSQLEFTPRDYNTITSRVKEGGGSFQQQLIFDHVSNATYIRAAISEGYVDRIYMDNYQVSPGRHNLVSCGAANKAWKGGYTGTAFQITSDRDKKAEEQAVSDAILDAWGDVEYVTYKLKDSIKEKGVEARKHVGVIAQDIRAAFEKHGLDPFELGILCYDNIPAIPEQLDGEGNVMQEAVPEYQGYTVRYEELLCLEAAYMRRQTKLLEAKLNSLSKVS